MRETLPMLCQDKLSSKLPHGSAVPLMSGKAWLPAHALQTLVNECEES